MQKGLDGKKAWQQAAEIVIKSESSRKKGCPKNTFFGALNIPNCSSKNAEYAKKALIIIKAQGKEKFANMKPSKFWIDEMQMSIKYNSQIDVIFALIDKNYL